jgi:hypothetical protein
MFLRNVVISQKIVLLKLNLVPTCRLIRLINGIYIGIVLGIVFVL